MRRRMLTSLLALTVLAASVLAGPPAASAATTTITASLSSPSVVVASPVDVVGSVDAPTATSRVVVQREVAGGWSDWAAGTVDPATGRFRVTLHPDQRGTVRLRVRSGGGSVVSQVLVLEVRPRPTVIGAWLSARTVRAGTAVQVLGFVVEPDAVDRVVVQRLTSAGWSDRESAAVDQRTGAFAVTIRPSSAGTYTLRVRSGGGSRTSGQLTLVVTPRPVQVITYAVTSRGAISSDLAAFARHAAATLADGRGWAMGGSIELRQVASGGDFTLVLAEASQLPSFGPPCHPSWSCRSGRYVIINDLRWRTGAPGWALSLDSYRRYVVNHEVGHWLGQGHASCPGAGAPGPVMMQQSKATAPCTNTVWPLGWERSQVAARRGVPIW